MIRDYISISFNSLRRRRLRSWLTMIGIFIGIAALVSLIGLGEGLRVAIMSQFGSLGSDLITVQAGGVQYGPPGSGVITPLDKENADNIGKVSGVKFAIPRLVETVKMEFNDRVVFSIAGSIPDGELRKEIESMFDLKVKQGRLLKDGDRNKVLLGDAFSTTSIFGRAIKSGDRVKINDKQFEVIGIMKKTGNFMLDGALIINEEILRDLVDKPDDVSLIAVKVMKDADMRVVKENIEKLLRKERDVDEGEEDFSVELAIDALESLNSSLFAVQLFVYIIAGISIVVGGIGIMNTMFTAVLERTKEIGIMKSIGAKNSHIFILFFIESGMLGMVGGIIGILIGAGIAKGLAAIGAAYLGSDLIQAEISFGLVFGALAFSFIIGCIAGTTPAVRASKLNPVDALRYAK